jgi:hypothetical protein
MTSMSAKSPLRLRFSPEDGPWIGVATPGINPLLDECIGDLAEIQNPFWRKGRLLVPIQFKIRIWLQLIFVLPGRKNRSFTDGICSPLKLRNKACVVLSTGWLRGVQPVGSDDDP